MALVSALAGMGSLLPGRASAQEVSTSPVRPGIFVLLGAEGLGLTGGEAATGQSLRLRGNVPLAGHVERAPEGFSGWVVSGAVEARTFVTDLPEVRSGARFLRLGLSLDALWASRPAMWFRLQAGAFTAQETALGAPRLHPHLLALGSVRLGDPVQLLYGTLYNDSLRAVPVLPISGLAWRITPRWRMDLLLPTLARATWNATPTASLHGAVTASGEGYRYRPREPSSPRLTRDLRLIRVRAGAGGRWRTSATTDLGIEAGAQWTSIDGGASRRHALGAYAEVWAGLRFGRSPD